MKRIDAETKRRLRDEMRDYLLGFPDVTAEEKQELRRWVASGRSPYDNRWELYNDYGWPFDFITAERIGNELVAEFECNPERFHNGSSTGDLESAAEEADDFGYDLSF